MKVCVYMKASESFENDLHYVSIESCYGLHKIFFNLPTLSSVWLLWLTAIEVKSTVLSFVTFFIEALISVYT